MKTNSFGIRQPQRTNWEHTECLGLTLMKININLVIQQLNLTMVVKQLAYLNMVLASSPASGNGERDRPGWRWRHQLQRVRLADDKVGTSR